MRRIIYPLPHTHSDFNIDNAYNDEFTVDLIYYNHRYPTPEWTIPQSIIDFTDVTYIPVSYTHLDVYKRQVYTPAASHILNFSKLAVTAASILYHSGQNFLELFITDRW